LGVYQLPGGDGVGPPAPKGQTQYWDQFAEHDRKGNVVYNNGIPVPNGGQIHFGDDKTAYLRDLANRARKENPLDVANKERLGGIYDVKSKLGAEDGYLFGGKYVTGEDLGNILAGVNGRSSGVSWDTFQRMAGALHQGAGMRGVGLAYFGKEYGPAPYYGEISIQYRESYYGYHDVYSTFFK
jgi:hypothetical protein